MAHLEATMHPWVDLVGKVSPTQNPCVTVFLNLGFLSKSYRLVLVCLSFVWLHRQRC